MRSALRALRRAQVRASRGASATPRLPQQARPHCPACRSVDFAQFGPMEIKPLSRIQRISGPRLHASWVNLPHVTQFDEADITELEELRASLKERPGRRHQAHAAGLHHPRLRQGAAAVPALQFLAGCRRREPDPRKYVHIGFAADTPNGLMVPVVRDADRKDIYGLARQLGELSEKARAGKLPIAEMQGGWFTISSLGGIGGTAFTPIINAPEVAILGVSRSAMQAGIQGRRVRAAADAAAVAVLRSPRHRWRAWRRASRPSWRRRWPNRAACSRRCP